MRCVILQIDAAIVPLFYTSLFHLRDSGVCLLLATCLLYECLLLRNQLWP
jgi:hypothetical protein